MATGGGKTLIFNLLNQSYQNFELIVINDGSTDGTENILNCLAINDIRIKVINKRNGGLSSARNAGLEIAQGEYVFFIDDDDDIPLDYIESFMNQENEGIDLVMDSYSMQKNNNPSIPVKFTTKQFNNSHTFLNYIFSEMINGPYCFFAIGKRFNTAVIKNNAISFKDNRQIIEDRPFMLDFTKFANSFKITDNHKYIVKDDSSQIYRLSSSVRPIDKWWTVFRNGYEYLKAYSRELSMPEILVYANNYLADKVLSYIILPFHEYYNARKSYFSREILPYLKYELDLSQISNKKTKSVYRSLFYIGLSPTLLLLKFVR